jgi:hypothetical protein
LGCLQTKDIQSGTITGLSATQNEDTEHSPQVPISVSRAPQTQETPVQLGRFTCDQCGEARACWKKPSKLDDHTKLCRERCRNCREANIPCKGLGNSCVACGERGVICEDFSHALLIKKSTMLCERCGIEAAWSDAHFRTCWGKCSNCRDRGIVCEKRTGGNPCKSCTENKLQCGDYSNEPEAKTCQKCGVDVRHPAASVFEKHYKSCKGKCKDCQDSNIPCDRSGRGRPAKCVTLPREELALRRLFASLKSKRINGGKKYPSCIRN